MKLNHMLPRFLLSLRDSKMNYLVQVERFQDECARYLTS